MHPEADGWAELQQQQEAQELWVWAQTRSAAGGSDVAPAAATYTAIRRRLHWPGWHADGEATDLYVNAPAQAAHIDIAASQQDCLGYTLATALYTNPDAGYVPVHWPNPPKMAALPSLTVAGITIGGPRRPKAGVRSGAELRRRANTGTLAGRNQSARPVHHHPGQGYGARRNHHECVTPANIAFLGEYEDECIWLTEGYRGDVAALRDALFDAYWPFHDPPEELTAEQYSDRMQTLATRLLEGDRTGFAGSSGNCQEISIPSPRRRRSRWPMPAPGIG